MSVKRSHTTVIVSAALGVFLLAGLTYLTRDRSLTGRNDFIQLYVGATLLGQPGLYSPDVNRELQVATVGVHLESVYFSRLPFYAFLLKPFSWLPYQTAYTLFQCLSMLALVGFLRMATGRVNEIVLFASLSIPLLSNFLAGQDLAFVLLFAMLSLTLASRGRDFEAGLVLTLCLIKPHLFVLVPIAFVAHRRWRYLLGGVIGTAVWLIGSTLAAGPNWISSYLALLRNPVLHPGPDHMPNLHGLTFAFGGPLWLEVMLSVAVVVIYIYFAFRSRDFELVFGMGLVAGLLLSFHAYAQDCTVLLLTFTIVASTQCGAPLRGLAALVVGPPLYLLLFAGAPYSAAVPLGLLLLLVVTAFLPSVSRLSTSQPRPVFAPETVLD